MYMEVPLTDIVSNPWQTRRGQPPDYIQSLALDIASNGLLQTPVGRLLLGSEIAPVDEITAAQLTGEIPDDCRVQLAFGHNRLSAYKWLLDLGPFSDIGGDWSSMPVELKPLTDEQMASFAWSENEKRRELSPIERAQAIARRIQDFGWSHEDAAENLGISRPSISNALRLLKLPDTVQDRLHAGEISERQAMALLKIFEQPEDLVDDDTFQCTADYLVRQALEGESSESLRQMVDSTVDEWKQKAQPTLISESEPEPTPEPQESDGQIQEAPAKPAPLSDIGWQTVIEPAEAISASPGPYIPAETYQRSEPIPQTETLQTEPEPEAEPEPAPVQDPEPKPKAAPAEKTGQLSLEQSTITMTITLWPFDGNSMGRLAVIAARINEQTPVMHMLREKELTLPHQLLEMIYKLGQDYGK